VYWFNELSRKCSHKYRLIWMGSTLLYSKLLIPTRRRKKK
jgi:hypothetical protein